LWVAKVINRLFFQAASAVGECCDLCRIKAASVITCMQFSQLAPVGIRTLTGKWKLSESIIFQSGVTQQGPSDNIQVILYFITCLLVLVAQVAPQGT